ncbi:MAG: peptidase [Crenarchaeota archaeon]|nr:MAG: peptidase [Thermoproteota archaeon]
MFSLTPAFGHGIGGETLPPVTIGDRNATIYLEIEPPVYDPNAGEQRILIRFFDADTDAVIEHVTYMVELKKDDKRIFRHMFHDDLGNLIMTIKSTDDENITVSGKEAPVLGGYMRDGDKPLVLQGPIFKSGGLYEFNVEILTLDEDSKVLDKRIFYRGAISVADKTNYDVKGGDDNDYQIGITSWYDQVSDFRYSPEEREVSFAMPFDWSKENIEQVQVVHEEVHIPKNFGELLVTKYDVMVNGIPLPSNTVVADDYSEEDRIVHAILPKSELLSIRDKASKVSDSSMFFTFSPSEEVVLPLVSKTTSYVYDISLWWEPLVIKSNEPTKFFVDISESYVIDKKKVPVEYDFVLTQYGEEIFRKRVTAEMNAPPKSSFEEITFSKDQVGPVMVAIENINDTFLGSTDFMIVVEPQETPIQEFPIRLESIGSEKEAGSYFVDITLIPFPQEINEESEFIITIYDKKTEMPIPGSQYDFVLLDQKGDVLKKVNGFAKGGGSFENHRFLEKDLGTNTLRIENINNSDEYVELPITVTPEFPFGFLVAFSLSLGMGIILWKRAFGIPNRLQI